MNKNKEIDNYIQELKEDGDIELANRVRKLMFENLPAECVERYTYSMCGYYLDKPVIYFAIAKQHLGIYPTPAGVTAAKEQGLLTNYSYAKGSIRIPKDDENLDLLVNQIINIRVQQMTA
ncbi:hypothetical protein RD055328_04040 [Companilactobacillus sp. RD055328]|uniref:iron chaperone n=1 Tax=Companilactobacillus sp. RD055328 TaxID=2916634 RepID=UPI001FC87B91|nr:DUF1801 domain-containing protein [Companilactobacillus sp. RD055328]GKQ42481.1 hypothetical protein RD055328_04040 [Companilactobacillus sp. RD055328]